ncbi:MAG TPA: PEP-CTERM sorting domain-containing protein, partial [Vicinamibacteria bacterium]|nr:PEP-CTERM sorting domain-containing protein [Vicinamibacteria bacterium]
FSEPVLVTSALIAAWANDFDAMFWGGIGSAPLTGFDALGAGFSSLFGPPHNAPANGSVTRSVSLLPLSNPIDWLVFGPPPHSLNADGKKDLFKFRSVTFTVPEEDTPEPGTLALLAIGTALLAARSRKQS